MTTERTLFDLGVALSNLTHAAQRHAAITANPELTREAIDERTNLDLMGVRLRHLQGAVRIYAEGMARSEAITRQLENFRVNAQVPRLGYL